MTATMRMLELGAWGFDTYTFRPELDGRKVIGCEAIVKRREIYQQEAAVCESESREMQERLRPLLSRCDLREEMEGLDWNIGIIDLRCLIAFQRRLSLSCGSTGLDISADASFDQLVEVAFGSSEAIDAALTHDKGSNAVHIRSANPNIHFRVTGDISSPIAVHAGTPFFEIAEYAGRWFLRDGYHRAHSLLSKAIFKIPAVIIYARTLEELGAVKPHFFSQSVLLSERPPLVTDFLDPALTIEYVRPPTIKTLRIVLEETLIAANPSLSSGEK